MFHSPIEIIRRIKIHMYNEFVNCEFLSNAIVITFIITIVMLLDDLECAQETLQSNSAILRIAQRQSQLRKDLLTIANLVTLY